MSLWRSAVCVAVVAGAAAIFFSVVSCDDDGSGNMCNQYCEGFIEHLDDCLDDGYYYGNCSVEDADGAVKECVEECNDVMSDLDGEDRSEANECIRCVYEDVGSSPDCGDIWESVADECEDECDSGGMEEFYDDFEPDLEDYIDCEYYYYG